MRLFVRRIRALAMRSVPNTGRFCRSQRSPGPICRRAAARVIRSRAGFVEDGDFRK